MEGLSNAQVRRRLQGVLLDDAALNAFCLDYFPLVYARFSIGMDRVTKVNLLLETTETDRILAALDRHLELPAGDESNPYRGLASFQVEDDALFFGRKRLTERLVDGFDELTRVPVGEPRLMVLYGPSGCGKSSLLRAGLVAALQKEAPPPAVVFCIPGTRPLESLASALVELVSDDVLPVARVRELTEELARAGPQGERDGLRRICDFIATRIQVHHRWLVLCIDQFEEVYSQARDPAEADAFVENLLRAGAEDSRLVVIVTLREDFLGATRRHAALNQVISTRGIFVPELTEAELREAIAGPAARAGRPFAIEVVEELLEQVRVNQGVLPLLQFALERIWEGLRIEQSPLATLRAIGGLGGALAGWAQQLYDELPTDEQRRTRRLFLRLIHLGQDGAADSRRRVPIVDLIPYGEDSAAIRRVLMHFSRTHQGARGRLITISLERSERGEVEVAAITHETLILRWGLLQEWLRIDRERLQLLYRLDSAAMRWEAEGRPSGLLWRSPDLERIRALVGQPDSDLNRRQVEFHGAAEQQAYKEVLAQRRSRRNTRLLWSSALLLTLVSVLGGWALRERSRAEVQRRYALEAAQRLSREQGRQQLLAGDAARAFVYLLGAYTDGDRPPALRLLLGRAAAELEQIADSMPLSGMPIADIQTDLDGKRILTVGHDGVIRLLDREHQGRVLRTFAEQTGADVHASLSPDASSVAISSTEHARTWVRLFALDSGELRKELTSPGVVTSLAFRPGRDELAITDKSGWVRILDLRTGQMLWSVRGHRGLVNAVRYSPDGRRLATAGGDEDKQALVWDSDRRVQLLTLSGHQRSLRDVQFSPDGLSLLTISLDETARIWDVQNGQLRHILGGHQGQVSAALWSPDGGHILTNSGDQQLRIWEVTSGRLIRSLRAPAGLARALLFLPDGSRLLMASSDSRLYSFRTEPPGESAGFFAATAINGTFIDFSPDGRLIATAGSDGTATLWDVASGALIRSLVGHREQLQAAVFSADSARLITASRDATAAIWDVADGKRLHTLQGHQRGVMSAAWSPDGRHAITGGEDGTLRWWSAETGKLLRQTAAHAGKAYSVAIEAHGRWAVSGGADRVARVWDLETGRERLSLTESYDAIRSVAISPDGQRIVTAGADGIVRLYAAESGRLLGILEGHGGLVYSVAFDPSGQFLVTAGGDRRARLWDTLTGELLFILGEHPERVYSAKFSPDGRHVATIGHASSIKLLDLPMETRSVQQLEVIHSCQVPFVLAAGRLFPAPLDPARCLQRAASVRAEASLSDRALLRIAETALRSPVLARQRQASHFFAAALSAARAARSREGELAALLGLWAAARQTGDEEPRQYLVQAEQLLRLWTSPNELKSIALTLTVEYQEPRAAEAVYRRALELMPADDADRPALRALHLEMLLAIGSYSAARDSALEIIAAQHVPGYAFAAQVIGCIIGMASRDVDVTRATCRQVAATYAQQEDGSEPEWNYEPLLQHLKYSALDLQTLARIDALCRTLGLPVTTLQRDALQAALGELTSPGQPVATKEKR